MDKRYSMLALALACCLVMPARAQDSAAYLGASLGQAEHKDACEDANISCDQKDSAWRVFGGFQFNRYLGVELGYADLGESSASGVVSGVTVSARFKVTAFDLAGIAAFPVTERFSVYGKLGVYRAELEATGSGTFGGTTIPFSNSENNTDVTYGVGVRFDFTRNLGIRAEWQQYPKVGSEEAGESDIDLLSAGVLWRF